MLLTPILFYFFLLPFYFLPSQQVNADASGNCVQGRQNHKPLFIFSSISGSSPDQARGSGAAPCRGAGGGPARPGSPPAPLPPLQRRGLPSAPSLCCNLPASGRGSHLSPAASCIYCKFFLFCLLLLFFAFFKNFCTFFCLFFFLVLPFLFFSFAFSFF